MRRLGRNRWQQSLLLGTHLFGILAVVYFHVLLRMEPLLLYSQDFAVFLIDCEFFTGFLDRPGWPVEYDSPLLSAQSQ